jgi:hypothetical protein
MRKANGPGSFFEPGRVINERYSLESLLQSDVPEPTFNSGN